MVTCSQDKSYTSLELPVEFEDLAGLVQADIQAIVAMLTQRRP